MRRRQRPSITVWLVELLPRFFDRALERVGLPQLKWIVLLLLLFSVPLITTPLKVWQQGVVAVLLMVVGQIVVRVEYHQSNQKTSEYLHLFLVWLSIVTTLRYLYYRQATP
jgi:cellulose synthase (UDP-forming)